MDIRSSRLKNILITFLQWLGASVGFLFCLVITNLFLPLPKVMMDAVPASGFIPSPLAFLANGSVNGLVLVWAARRSSLKGVAMWLQLLTLSFGAQTFMTQIETAYFISAFPLLHGNFELYQLILRGLITSALFTLLVTLMAGGFSQKPRAQSTFMVSTDHAVKNGSWLAVIYIILYMLFGYFVAWQSQELRLFYGGPAELNSFTAQWGLSLMQRPELPVFQYFRGFLWLLCLIPLFIGFNGRCLELVILSALALGLLPTMQLAFANPLMPAGVSLYHFIEVSITTGIFGALCAWFVPRIISTN
jgi:hypothetical protein